MSDLVKKPAATAVFIAGLNEIEAEKVTVAMRSRFDCKQIAFEPVFSGDIFPIYQVTLSSIVWSDSQIIRGVYGQKVI